MKNFTHPDDIFMQFLDVTSDFDQQDHGHIALIKAVEKG